MRMQKVQFRIGEMAKHLKVEKFVIRFWEKEFKLATNRSRGGQRFYSQEDLEQFARIKELLYEQGFTIAGAKKYIQEQEPNQLIGSCKTTLQQNEPEAAYSRAHITQKLLELRKKLVELDNLL